jgi:hypothetical protein
LATIHSSNSRLVGVPADDRMRLRGNRRQLANETPLSPLEKWRLVIIHLRSTYANARSARLRVSPGFGEERVSHSVGPHDRFGLPVGSQADECYGDVRREVARVE